MTDIINAYNVEQQYIEENLGNSGINLLDLLIPYGYSDLSNYFQEKKEYIIAQEQLNIQHNSVQDTLNKMFVAINNGTPGVFAIDEDTTWAWTGQDEIVKGIIPDYNLGYNGGTIITDNNDFNIAINFPTSFNLDSDFWLNKMNNILLQKGYKTIIDGNDIMINNKKIGGSAFYTNGISGIFYLTITLSDHNELINQICLKPQIKEPSFLSGITKKEIEEEVIKCL